LNSTTRYPYFAYGSNLDPEGMKYRAPDARPLGRAVLLGYALAFDGVATLMKREGAKTFGGLWSVSQRDLARLDRYEGEGTSYDRRLLTVRDADEREVSAWVYLLRDAELSSTYTPYFRTIARGYEAFGLPVEALQRAAAAAIDVEYERARP
jgi:gamma-glutamylcyclotransferase (GGCT)/AIG2-like uncharacterized protein YtfP